MRGVAGLEDHRHGIAHHGTHVRHEVAGLLEVEAVLARIVPGDLLPAVVDRGRIPAFQLQQFGIAQSRGSVCSSFTAKLLLVTRTVNAPTNPASAER